MNIEDYFFGITPGRIRFTIEEDIIEHFRCWPFMFLWPED